MKGHKLMPLLATGDGAVTGRCQCNDWVAQSKAPGQAARLVTEWHLEHVAEMRREQGR